MFLELVLDCLALSTILALELFINLVNNKETQIIVTTFIKEKLKCF
jgi:hypothetical protein